MTQPDPKPTVPPARVGAYGPDECLMVQLARLIGVEADSGADGDATARYRKVPT